MEEQDILDSGFTNENKNTPKKRRSILPVWVVIFCLIFMLMGAVAALSIPFALLGFSFNLSLLGLATQDPLSFNGLILNVLFILKGITGYSLFMGKDRGIDLGIMDATFSILVSIYVMLVLPNLNSNSFQFSFQIEILFIIPYLFVMLSRRKKWKELKA